uniref:Glycosyltransferase 61 catalytic domain-containing protein n=1 Tax=Haptolina ericina TaxID=156174 RepID=A0A7S3B0R3_9EUKA|mmetsp:Transcript_45802/g.103190  ORF Transcript_45802/g.103190 Transcript_45802/m.103190 type:complete len:207 (+) Transcript_45802:209-829(+)
MAVLGRLRDELHACVGASGVGREVILYTRADTSRRKWYRPNALRVADAIAAAVSHRVPVRVVDKMPWAFDEQVRLFANASALVMPHGAASTNAIALPVGAIFIELCPGATSWLTHTNLSRRLSAHFFGEVLLPPVTNFLDDQGRPFQVRSDFDVKNPPQIEVHPQAVVRRLLSAGLIGAPPSAALQYSILASERTSFARARGSGAG